MLAITRQRLAHDVPDQGRSLSGTNLQRAGDHNQRVTLQAIRVHGPATRADLAHLTGLTTSTIASITKRLLADDIIMEIGRRHDGGRGQPAMRLAINPEGCFSIGVNLDRGHLTVVGLDLMGGMRARISHEIDLTAPEGLAASISADIHHILTVGGIDESRLVGIGVAVPDDLGRVTLPHWPDDDKPWQDTDIYALFQDFPALPIFLENDAATAAIGELEFGHGIRYPNFFYILICGGLGGGLVIDGHYCRGAEGRSGEIGFIPIPPLKNSNASILQDIVSLSGLYERLAEAGYAVSRPEQLATLDAKARAVVAQWVEASSQHLVVPVISINCILNPQAIFLGGPLPLDVLDDLTDRLNQQLRAHALSIPATVQVQRAKTSVDASAIGAALLPFMHLLLPSRDAMVKTVAA